MTSTAHRTFAVTLLLALAGSAGALAAGPSKGKTYEGGVPAWGVDGEHHRQRTHTSGNIVLKVAARGTSVTVRFSSSYPILYCAPQEPLRKQSTKPVSISGRGTFTAAIAQRFKVGPGPPGIVQVVTGQFSGRTVRGTIRTHAAEYCSGVTNFSATAR
jgi:hypothetical protein